MGCKVKQIISIQQDPTLNLSELLRKREENREEMKANDINSSVTNQIDWYSKQQKFLFEESQKNRVI